MAKSPFPLILPEILETVISNLTLSPVAILVVILVVYLFLGCVMDSLAIILLTLPIVFPVVMALGLDPIWFGILYIINIEIALFFAQHYDKVRLFKKC